MLFCQTGLPLLARTELTETNYQSRTDHCDGYRYSGTDSPCNNRKMQWLKGFLKNIKMIETAVVQGTRSTGI